MKKDKEFYKKNRIRFMVFPNKELLLNKSDVCKVLGINTDAERESELSEPSIDKSRAILTAISLGETNDVEFVEWLQETFVDFNNVYTGVNPLTDNLWDYE